MGALAAGVSPYFDPLFTEYLRRNGGFRDSASGCSQRLESGQLDDEGL